MADVAFHREADQERVGLPPAELFAMNTVISKLRAVGARLTFPHQSQIKGANDLRELRPRAGRSPWRAFYRRVGPDNFVIGAIGPEATVNPKEFKRAVAMAESRLDDLARRSATDG